MSIEEIKDYLEKEIERLEAEEENEIFNEQKMNHLLGQIYALSKLLNLLK